MHIVKESKIVEKEYIYEIMRKIVIFYRFIDEKIYKKV